MSLTLIVTDAGRAALVDAATAGTLPVLISEIGVTETAVVADAAATDLAYEIKRLDTLRGAALAADTIHFTVADDSTDVYALRGFALYLDDGTLFALYGQADPIMAKTADTSLLIAADVTFADIDVTDLTFGDTDFSARPATDTYAGIVELATDVEAIAGTDAERVITPATLKAVLDDQVANIDLDLASEGYYVHPGGLIDKWGEISGSYSQGTAYFAFPDPFPTACFNVQITPKNGTPENDNDYWIQTDGAPTRFGQNVFVQLGNSGSGTCPGWYWRAVGK